MVVSVKHKSKQHNKLLEVKTPKHDTRGTFTFILDILKVIANTGMINIYVMFKLAHWMNFTQT